MLQFPGGQAATADAFPELPSGGATLAQTACLLGPSMQAAGVLLSGYNALYDLQLMYRDPQGGGGVGFKYGPIIQGLYPGGFVFPASLGFRCRSHVPGTPAAMIGQVWDIQDGPLPQTPLSPNLQTLTSGGVIITPGGGNAISVVTASTFPATPSNGQQIAYTDSLAAPTYTWYMLYDTGISPPAWRFLGGSWLRGTTTLTIPRAGDYMIEIGCSAISVGANNNTTLTLTAGGITLNAFGGNTGGGTQGGQFSIYDADVMAGLTASQVLTPTVGGNLAPTRQYIRARPVKFV